MVPPSTRMRGAPQPETNWFRWEFRSEKPVRAQADELPDSKALIVGTATAEHICGGLCYGERQNTGYASTAPTLACFVTV
jgi:hypothetical protein